jgi:hypothetical protein
LSPSLGTFVILSELLDKNIDTLNIKQIKRGLTSTIEPGTLGIYRQATHQTLDTGYGYVEEVRIVTCCYTNAGSDTGMGTEASIMLHISPVTRLSGNIAYYNDDKIMLTYLKSNKTCFASNCDTKSSFGADACSFDLLSDPIDYMILGRTYARNGILLEENGKKCNKNLNGMIPKHMQPLFLQTASLPLPT